MKLDTSFIIVCNSSKPFVLLNTLNTYKLFLSCGIVELQPLQLKRNEIELQRLFTKNLSARAYGSYNPILILFFNNSVHNQTMTDFLLFNALVVSASPGDLIL